MIFHILNGDSLAHTFAQSSIPGELIICREALVDGPVQANSLDTFWGIRASYIAQAYGGHRDQYYQKVVSEMDKMLRLPKDAEICLWFEDDLFCQTNMWFLLSLLGEEWQGGRIRRVFPVMDAGVDHWRGFGASDPALLAQSFAQRVSFESNDLDLGIKLWEAYRSGNFERLLTLSHLPSPCFRHLPEVCQAQVDRFPVKGQLGRPEQLIADILQHTPKDFNVVFAAFGQKAGVYGFGDTQVKGIYERVLGMEELI